MLTRIDAFFVLRALCFVFVFVLGSDTYSGPNQSVAQTYAGITADRYEPYGPESCAGTSPLYRLSLAVCLFEACPKLVRVRTGCVELTDWSFLVSTVHL